jgi:ankyrin repeat protein
MHRQPVHLAAESGQLASMEFLIHECHADPNSTTDFAQTPLHFAAKEGHENMLELLLNFGSDITAVDYRKRTGKYCKLLTCQYQFHGIAY